jgi:hypothetical protein
MDNKEMAWSDYEIKKERKKERKKGQMERLLVTPSWQRKMIDGEWQSGSFDELLSFGKKRQKAKTWVFTSVTQEEAFDLLFVVKTRQMTRLRQWPSSTARFYGLGVDWTKTELSLA